MRWVGWIVLAVLAAASVLAPRFFRRILRSVDSLLDGVARRRRLAIIACATLAAAGSIAVAALVKWPEPREHDEFSYLLAADTFAHGRLANPTHPMWRHLETFHVLEVPTYSSKFPPAQGLFLALGQAAFGHPIAGVWASGALMAAAICWMLFGFLPPRWALLGGLLAVARFSVATYWTQSYWGGAVAALGGALVLGAVPRIVRGARVRDAMLLAAGLVLLANSRPFEGLVAALPAAFVLAAWFVRRGGAGWRQAAVRVVAPVLLVVVPAGLWMVAYNVAVTGAPFRFPYRAYQDAYPFAPLFLWLDLSPAPAYRHAVIAQLSDALIEPYRTQHTLSGFLSEAGGKLVAFWRFFVGPQLSVALVALPWVLRRRWMGLAASTLLLMLLALLGETYYMHHYFAPMTGAVVLLLTAALRILATWRPRGAPLGQALAYAIVLAGVVSIADQARGLRSPPPAEWRRSAILADLEREGGRHLVIVRYGSQHVPNYEWVYNRADIDGAAVVWAHDLGREANRPLLDYFRDRKVSLVEAGFDAGPPVIKPYRD